jgi:hypothetical protein
MTSSSTSNESPQSADGIERVQVKLFATDPDRVELEAFVPVFHRWIQDRVLEDELPIDVADYAHVHEGPGVVLVGHGADYYLDLGEGRPGLLFSRKRALEGTFQGRLEDALRRAERACQLLEADSALDGLRFGRDELLIRVHDRLRAPNTDATFATLRPAIETALTGVYDGKTVELSREGGERQPLTVRARLA